MGLAAPKNRIKLSSDPNNTKWQSDKESFGLKIMTSQGWQPGQYLGAINAKQAEFHTVANASHIRVSIKDDNLGLGAKIGNGVGHGECTGLDAFKDLLGRLNGKNEDEIEKEQKSREDLRRAIYTERKWGSIRFVTGGFLIGDKIQQLIDTEAERIRKLALGDKSTSASDASDSDSSSDSEEEAPAPIPVEKPKKSKKRNMDVIEGKATVLVEKQKRSNKRKIEAIEEEERGEERGAKAVKVKKSKKIKIGSDSEDTQGIATPAEDSVRCSKKSKKERKSKVEEEDIPSETELKRRKKENKHKKERKEKPQSNPEETEKESKKKKKSKRDKDKSVPDLVPDSSESSRLSTKESTPSTPLPTESGRSTPMMQGRHAVRSRNIAQKRLASMDVASLNQIFMIKS